MVSAARVAPGGETERHQATGGVVRIAGGAGLVRVGDRAFPVGSIVRVALWLPPTLPADAMILLEGDAPRVYWYVPGLYALLGLLSLVMVWALVRSLRTEPAAGGNAGGIVSPV
jgi:hypothetical protein